jgi:hypothetical protein
VEEPDDDEWVLLQGAGGWKLTVTNPEIRTIGKTAKMGFDRGVFAGLRYHHPGDEGQPALEMAVEVRDGAPVCTEIRLIADDSSQVRVKDLRMIAGTLEDHLENIAAASVWERAPGAKWWGQGTPAFREDRERLARSQRKLVQTARRTAHARVSPEAIATAADLYRAAQGNRLKAIEDGLGVSQRTAARYVAKAREAGLLDD